MNPPDHDERLAAVIDDLSRRQRAGEAVDVSAVSAQHPDLAKELRELWAAHQLADALVHTATVPAPPDNRPPAPALKSFGDFEVLQELGRGGMGVVYLAKQRSLNRLVALKVVLHGALASDSDRARFRTEAAATARLIHPNIVTVFEVGEHESRPYFVMQHVQGETLARRLARGPLPAREAARIVAGIARGVHLAHTQGIIHRDLKPSNVLLDGNRESGVGSRPDIDLTDSRFPTPDSRFLIPRVADFGLAKDMGAGTPITATGAVLGTPSYMAPEQAAGGREVTPAVDVYALGAILYECLTGRPPFQAATALDTLMLVLEQEPVPPRLLNPGTPRELEAIALKCLEKSPGRRYASATALAEDLDAFLSGETISATPSGLGYFLDRVFRETHHAAVLENWGVLWMWHSLVTLTLCTLTQVMEWSGYGSHTAYLILWSVGLITWGAIFWSLRRRGGPVRFVERQVAHAWAAGVAASIGMFILEVLMGEPALKFSPLLAVAAGMTFLFKAGVLAGIFYIAAIVMFATAVLMAIFPQCGVLLFGISTAACFFFPGLKYYRQRLRSDRNP